MDLIFMGGLAYLFPGAVLLGFITAAVVTAYQENYGDTPPGTFIKEMVALFCALAVVIVPAVLLISVCAWRLEQVLPSDEWVGATYEDVASKKTEIRSLAGNRGNPYYFKRIKKESTND